VHATRQVDITVSSQSHCGKEVIDLQMSVSHTATIMYDLGLDAILQALIGYSYLQ